MSHLDVHWRVALHHELGIVNYFELIIVELWAIAYKAYL